MLIDIVWAVYWQLLFSDCVIFFSGCERVSSLRGDGDPALELGIGMALGSGKQRYQILPG
jgi:hypothetical protein